MEVKWLQDFVTLAEMGNFTRAAEARNSSQAAFSRRIQSLEHWLGATLIDRSSFPTRLTVEGQRFRAYATEILGQVADARGELSGTPTRDHVRIALPYALATASLPTWWNSWARDRTLSCSLVSGNVHDMVAALIAGTVDVLICFTTPQQPVQLDAELYEKRELRREFFRPYASPVFLRGRSLAQLDDPKHPLPLLMYSPGVYFGRLVELILEATPHKVNGRRIIESDMADVLRDMVVAGHGVAWLPDCVALQAAGPALYPIDEGTLSLEITTIAYRSFGNHRKAVARLWDRLAADRT